MQNDRKITMSQAIGEATLEAMKKDDTIFVIGEGVMRDTQILVTRQRPAIEGRQRSSRPINRTCTTQKQGEPELAWSSQNQSEKENRNELDFIWVSGALNPTKICMLPDECWRVPSLKSLEKLVTIKEFAKIVWVTW